eukprot:TRINITY_DN2931_c0_g1_i1.p2 TRINITY_DN2931_c0_g1~~TRINITY_DN2931_c0_g1_i1.p2  ORF type:complete len:341 (+),score=99.24 TRINITY_DN2931_c0_g1_i1:1807-2829(+)
MFESLHNHTTSSDGCCTYEELLEEAKQRNYSVIAFTDHDIPMNVDKYHELKEIDLEIDWISGIEMSSNSPNDFGDRGNCPVSNFHIVGLFVDPENKPLQMHSLRMKKAREERLGRIVKGLKELDFDIEEETVLKYADTIIGRPHIVEALEFSTNAHNLSVHNQYKNECIDAARRGDLNARRVLKEWRERFGNEAKPSKEAYSLYLSKNAFVGGVDVVVRNGVDFDTCVDLIRQAGGKAILAHPYLYCPRIFSLENLLDWCNTGRIDGVEIYSNFPRNPEAEYIQKALLKCCVDNNLLITGGNDAHRPEHLNYQNPKTVGLTRNLLKFISEDSQRFSSLKR